jgi:hypothetical protein
MKNTRKKMNAVALAAVVVTAGVIGLATSSWLVFGVALVTLTVLAVYVGLLRRTQP